MSGLKLRLRRLIHRGPLMPDGSIPGRYTKAQLQAIDEWADRTLARRTIARTAGLYKPPRHAVEMPANYKPLSELTDEYIRGLLDNDKDHLQTHLRFGHQRQESDR
jgi:hypothetical protein